MRQKCPGPTWSQCGPDRGRYGPTTGEEMDTEAQTRRPKVAQQLGVGAGIRTQDYLAP